MLAAEALRNPSSINSQGWRNTLAELRKFTMTNNTAANDDQSWHVCIPPMTENNARKDEIQHQFNVTNFVISACLGCLGSSVKELIIKDCLVVNNSITVPLTVVGSEQKQPRNKKDQRFIIKLRNCVVNAITDASAVNVDYIGCCEFENVPLYFFFRYLLCFIKFKERTISWLKSLTIHPPRKCLVYTICCWIITLHTDTTLMKCQSRTF